MIQYQILQTNIKKLYGRQWGELLMRSWELKVNVHISCGRTLLDHYGSKKKTKARFKTNCICWFFCYFFSLQTDCLMSLIPQRQIKGEGQEAFAKKQWISLKNMTSQIWKSRARCQTKADVVSRVKRFVFEGC